MTRQSASKVAPWGESILFSSMSSNEDYLVNCVLFMIYKQNIQPMKWLCNHINVRHVSAFNNGLFILYALSKFCNSIVFLKKQWIYDHVFHTLIFYSLHSRIDLYLINRNSAYFSGEVKLSMDASQHKSQFPDLLPDEEVKEEQKSHSDEEIDPHNPDDSMR